MTGDVGELFNEYKRIRKQKRADNRSASAELLDNHGIEYESKNGGAHLIVRHNDKVVDYWPGTGLWMDRHSKARRRGIRKLMSHLES